MEWTPSDKMVFGILTLTFVITIGQFIVTFFVGRSDAPDVWMSVISHVSGLLEFMIGGVFGYVGGRVVQNPQVDNLGNKEE